MIPLWLISAFPYHKFSLVIFSKHQSWPPHLPLPAIPGSVTGSNYDSTVYCVSNSETTKDSLIFSKPKVCGKAQKASMPSSDQRGKRQWRGEGFPQPGHCSLWSWRMGPQARSWWLFSYRYHNCSDIRTFLLLVTFNRRMGNNSENLTISFFPLSFFWILWTSHLENGW